MEQSGGMWTDTDVGGNTGSGGVEGVLYGGIVVVERDIDGETDSSREGKYRRWTSSRYCMEAAEAVERRTWHGVRRLCAWRWTDIDGGRGMEEVDAEEICVDVRVLYSSVDVRVLYSSVDVRVEHGRGG
jgi:hypothetical protein